MDRNIQSKLNAISRKSLDNLVNDLLKKHQVSMKKPNLSQQDKKELRSLVKEFQSAFKQITRTMESNKTNTQEKTRRN
ncbi:hypothetical protein [Bacillus tuaregi]|uniref:hypothetical protein n=1 Tax=Bacillus tuaregi TaxID=1816695 RepID=UPI0008F832D7|nr:hypothetical protein [Bacillus tuaregi]